MTKVKARCCGIILFLLLAAVACPARAAGRGLGLGVILGEPTGLSLKSWTNGAHAYDAAAAWSFEGRDFFQFHADYLFHRSSGLEGELGGDAPAYVGIGGRIAVEDDSRRGGDGHHTHAGVRIPFGISWFPAELPPLEFFAEIVPGIDLAPGTDFFLNAGLGVRYYFR